VAVGRETSRACARAGGGGVRRAPRRHGDR
jgi:hypothetical protein